MEPSPFGGMPPLGDGGSGTGAAPFDVLLGMIDSGALEPGTALGEHELAALLGTSRTPAREAINRLKELGLAESSAGRKTRIVAVGRDRLRDTLVVWTALTPVVLRATVPELSEARIDALPPGAGISALVRALDALAGEAGNPHIARRMAAVGPVLRIGLGPADDALTTTDAEAFDAALRRRDTAAAIGACRHAAAVVTASG